MPSTNISNKIVSLVDPTVLSIPVYENHDEMLDLKHQALIAFGPSPEIPDNTDYTKMRKPLYEKLLQAQKMLPNDLKFCLYEGYRSLQLQEKLFKARFQKIQAEYPGWSNDEIFMETTKMVSPVINLDGTKNIPPHSTGAAIDIYLINAHSEIVDMGIKVADWMHDLDGSISQTDCKQISAAAIKHREIMGNVLTQVGFVNYPGEYWHWSYGDRYWANYAKQEFAFYGSWGA